MRFSKIFSSFSLNSIFFAFSYNLALSKARISENSGGQPAKIFSSLASSLYALEKIRKIIKKNLVIPKNIKSHKRFLILKILYIFSSYS